MEQDKSFLAELVGKMILVKTHYGTATSVDMKPGDYKGILLGYDGTFIKLEYDFRKFVSGAGVAGKTTVLINIAYIISIEEHPEVAE